MKTLIIGMGEVGRAHYNLLSKVYDVTGFDIVGDYQYPSPTENFEIMHVCIRYTPEFLDIVREYMHQYQPRLVNVCTTTPPGTVEQLGDNVVHSTTRGLHPNLETGLQKVLKHVGGPKSAEVGRYFQAAGIPSTNHRLARTTEVAHILNNTAYGINLVWADVMARICRHYGVDYFESVMKYTSTHNLGYAELDHPGKQRMVLTPPGGKIGGHCVVQSAQLVADEVNEPLMTLLATYNDPKEK